MQKVPLHHCFFDCVAAGQGFAWDASFICVGFPMPSTLSLDFHTLRTGYRSGTLTPSRLVEAIIARIGRNGDDHVWISRVPDEALRAAAKALEASGTIDDLPLFGLPFAVKDNIDVAGMTTTAGCPDYAYRPAESAPVRA